MRSRYSAYVIEDAEWLLSTWMETTRPSKIEFQSDTRWLRLDIRQTRDGQRNDSSGEVEFIAVYKINGRAHRLHEISQFRKINGRWLYLSGNTPNA